MLLHHEMVTDSIVCVTGHQLCTTVRDVQNFSQATAATLSHTLGTLLRAATNSKQLPQDMSTVQHVPCHCQAVILQWMMTLQGQKFGVVQTFQPGSSSTVIGFKACTDLAMDDDFAGQKFGRPGVPARQQQQQQHCHRFQGLYRPCCWHATAINETDRGSASCSLL